MKIIDVSNYQGNIDWKMVKADGVEGVIIRAGWGKGNVDPKFKKNIDGAISVGMNVGIYWFSYAYTVDMAKKEVEYCDKVINPWKACINLPVFFDWEYDSMNWAKKNGVTPGKQLITDMNLAFCDGIAKLGYKSGYYLNQDYSKNYIDESKLKAHKRWFAKYTVVEQKDCYLWQYSSKGRVAGINGNVDMDKLFDTDGVKEEPKEEQKEEQKTGLEGIAMPVIKKGSRGKAVKIWQIIIGVNADGIFGQKTLEATLNFQKKKKLEVDGIVGKNTWKAGLESV